MMKTAYIGASRDSAGTGRGHFEDLTDYGFAFQPSPRGPRRIPRMDGFIRGLIDGLKKEGALPAGFRGAALVKKFRGPQQAPGTVPPSTAAPGAKSSFLRGLSGHLGSFAKGLNPEMMMQGMGGMMMPQMQQPAPPPTPEEEQRKRERSRTGVAGGLGLHGAM